MMNSCRLQKWDILGLELCMFLCKFWTFLTVKVIMIYYSFVIPKVMITQNISLESPYYGLLTIFVLRSVVGLIGYILPFRKYFMFIFLIFWGDFIIYYGCTCQRTFPFVALLNILCMQSLIIMVKFNFGLLLRFCQI